MAYEDDPPDPSYLRPAVIIAKYLKEGGFSPLEALSILGSAIGIIAWLIARETRVEFHRQMTANLDKFIDPELDEIDLKRLRRMSEILLEDAPPVDH